MFKKIVCQQLENQRPTHNYQVVHWFIHLFILSFNNETTIIFIIYKKHIQIAGDTVVAMSYTLWSYEAYIL